MKKKTWLSIYAIVIATKLIQCINHNVHARTCPAFTTTAAKMPHNSWMWSWSLTSRFLQSQNILVLLANRTICFALLLTAQSLDQLVVLQVQQPSSVQGIPGLTELITTSQLENLLRDNEYLKINHKSKARTATKQSTRDTWASRVSSFCLKIRSVLS